MQLDYLLGVVFLVLDMVTCLIDFLYDARVKLAIARVNGLAVSALLEELMVGLFEYF